MTGVVGYDAIKKHEEKKESIVHKFVFNGIKQMRTTYVSVLGNMCASGVGFGEVLFLKLEHAKLLFFFFFKYEFGLRLTEEN